MSWWNEGDDNCCLWHGSIRPFLEGRTLKRPVLPVRGTVVITCPRTKERIVILRGLESGTLTKRTPAMAARGGNGTPRHGLPKSRPGSLGSGRLSRGRKLTGREPFLRADDGAPAPYAEPQHVYEEQPYRGASSDDIRQVDLTVEAGARNEEEAEAAVDAYDGMFLSCSSCRNDNLAVPQSLDGSGAIEDSWSFQGNVERSPGAQEGDPIGQAIIGDRDEELFDRFDWNDEPEGPTDQF